MVAQVRENKILILATEHCAYPGANSVGQTHSTLSSKHLYPQGSGPGIVPREVLSGLFPQRYQRNNHHVLWGRMPL